MILLWFLGAVIGHDLVLFPLYTLADRSLTAGLRAVAPSRGAGPSRVAAVNYLRVPLLGTGLLFLLFFPGIIGQGSQTYLDATGLTQEPYLGRWLLITAAMFLISGRLRSPRRLHPSGDIVMTGVRDLVPGERFPDLSLPDSDGNVRRLTELAGPDPLLVHTYRGWFCPKERAYLRRLVDLQGDAEVAYTRFVSLSVESPAVNGAFRAGLDARWTFLSDEDRTALNGLGLREVTDTIHDPYLPTVWLLAPDLTVHRWWMGYWYWGRPTLDELRVELRALTRGLRKDWDPPRPDDKP